jgi:4-hydroxy-2-oxoheptanedioate aldolase
MDLPANPFKRAIKAGKPQIGLWLSLSSHYSAEVCAGSGFDWLLLDSEHSPNELDMLLCQLQAIAPYPSHPIVRIPWNDTVTIKRVLDVGAQTLLIPYVSSVEEARAAVAATRIRRRACAAWRHDPRDALRQSQNCEARGSAFVQSNQAGLEARRSRGRRVDGVTTSDLHASFGSPRPNPAVLPKIDDALGPRVRQDADPDADESSRSTTSS